MEYRYPPASTLNHEFPRGNIIMLGCGQSWTAAGGSSDANRPTTCLTCIAYVVRINVWRHEQT